MRHAAHDSIAATVAGWYREPAPEMGYVAERRPYGWVQRHPAVAGAAITLDVSVLTPDAVGGLVAEIAAEAGSSADTLRVDDRAADGRLAPALVAAGCERETAASFLAFTGAPSPARLPIGIAIEDVGAGAAVETWARTKLAGFADGTSPTAEALRAEVAIRTAECRGQGRLRLARIGSEPAAALACYAGDDSLIFSLATLPRFRRAGAARALLDRTVVDALARGARSVLINADPEDWPHAWYRRYGFDDEVYWQRTYGLPGARHA